MIDMEEKGIIEYKKKSFLRKIGEKIISYLKKSKKRLNSGYKEIYDRDDVEDTDYSDDIYDTRDEYTNCKNVDVLSDYAKNYILENLYGINDSKVDNVEKTEDIIKNYKDVKRVDEQVMTKQINLEELSVKDIVKLNYYKTKKIEYKFNKNNN